MAGFCDQLAQKNLASAFVYLLLSVLLRGEHIYVRMYQGRHTRKRHMADSSAIPREVNSPLSYLFICLLIFSFLLILKHRTGRIAPED